MTALLLCLSAFAASSADVLTNSPPPSTNSVPASGPATNATAATPRLLPDDALTGQVVRVNTKARFAVLSFPLLRMPEIGQYLAIWRTNAVVGQARVSGPQRDETIIADLVSGEWKVGDEVREQAKPAKPAVKDTPRQKP